ncbi:MAG: class I SAM-dependent methyltransferase [Candidatus Hodarchaeales archaeon]|jgi:SAM-dependent methyltransferase
MTNRLNREGWNKISERYQQQNAISLFDVHYGPFAPGEKEERLLGDVQGRNILELGCGGGQNAIVLAKWGANVWGVDQSVKQLEYARQLANKEEVAVKFLETNMESIPELNANSFDIILSSHAINYVENLEAVFRECARLLKSGGRFVLCLAHPVAFFAWEALEEDNFALIQERRYFMREESWEWDFPDGYSVPFESRLWTLEDIFNGIISSGLVVEKVREPKGYDISSLSPEELNQVPYKWGAPDAPEVQKFSELNQKIPYSIIVVASKK